MIPSSATNFSRVTTTHVYNVGLLTHVAHVCKILLIIVCVRLVRMRLCAAEYIVGRLALRSFWYHKYAYVQSVNPHGNLNTQVETIICWCARTGSSTVRQIIRAQLVKLVISIHNSFEFIVWLSSVVAAEPYSEPRKRRGIYIYSDRLSSVKMKGKR